MLVTPAHGDWWIYLMASPAPKAFVIWQNGLEMIVSEWKSTNGIVINKSDIDWSWNGCKLIKVHK